MAAHGDSLDILGISHVGFSVTRLEQFIDTWEPRSASATG